MTEKLSHPSWYGGVTAGARDVMIGVIEDGLFNAGCDPSSKFDTPLIVGNLITALAEAGWQIVPILRSGR